MAFTVRAMDAGPVLAQEERVVDATVQAPQLLQELFAQGTELLLNTLPQVWSRQAPSQAQPQVSSIVKYSFVHLVLPIAICGPSA